MQSSALISIDRKDEKILQQAKDIVQRFQERNFTLPRNISVKDRTTPAEVQEAKDAQKIKNWKKSFKNMPGQSRLPTFVKAYLDEHLLGWRDLTHAADTSDPPLQKAMAIVGRCVQDGHEFPSRLKQQLLKEKRMRMRAQRRQQAQQGERQDVLEQQQHVENVADEAIRQAQRDHDRLRYWLTCEDEGRVTEGTLSALRYCDQNIPGWREPEALYSQAVDIFENILAKYNNNASSSSSSSSHRTISRRAFCSWYDIFTAESKETERKLLKGRARSAPHRQVESSADLIGEGGGWIDPSRASLACCAGGVLVHDGTGEPRAKRGRPSGSSSASGAPTGEQVTSSLRPLRPSVSL